MNKNKIINLTGLSKKYKGILITTQEELMEVLNDKDVSLLAISPKKINPPVDDIPGWFKPYAEKIDLLINERNQVPKWFLDYSIKQNEVNNKILDRLDKLDSRIDNLVKKNNLKE